MVAQAHETLDTEIHDPTPELEERCADMLQQAEQMRTLRAPGIASPNISLTKPGDGAQNPCSGHSECCGDSFEIMSFATDLTIPA
jgi:hypothetical protein